MYYRIDNDEDNRCDSVEAAVEYCIPDDYYDDCQDAFDEYLDEDGEIDVCGVDLYPSTILRELARTQYDDQYNDWAADQLQVAREDANSNLSNLNHGDWCYVAGYQVWAYDDDEEDEEEHCERSQLHLDERISSIEKSLSEKAQARASAEEAENAELESFYDILQVKPAE